MNPILNDMLSRKTGCDVTTSAGAEILCRNIESVTGERLGLNTVKRIVGILDYEGNHRKMIMDIIARYLDFASWELLKAKINNDISGFSLHSTILDLEALPVNQKIMIKWDPDRQVVLIHKNGRIFEVEDSLNSKLEKGDMLRLSQIAPGFPFYASEVIRNNVSLGNYSAAMVAGIKSISII